MAAAATWDSLQATTLGRGGYPRSRLLQRFVRQRPGWGAARWWLTGGPRLSAAGAVEHGRNSELAEGLGQRGADEKETRGRVDACSQAAVRYAVEGVAQIGVGGPAADLGMSDPLQLGQPPSCLG